MWQHFIVFKFRHRTLPNLFMTPYTQITLFTPPSGCFFCLAIYLLMGYILSAMTRIARESKTIRAMCSLYCRQKHGLKALCQECESLQDYALKRLKFCTFGEQKSTCANCKVHCYAPKERQLIQNLMREIGPALIWRHPILSLWHLWDGIKDKLNSKSWSQ